MLSKGSSWRHRLILNSWNDGHVLLLRQMTQFLLTKLLVIGQRRTRDRILVLICARNIVSYCWNLISFSNFCRSERQFFGFKSVSTSDYDAFVNESWSDESKMGFRFWSFIWQRFSLFEVGDCSPSTTNSDSFFLIHDPHSFSYLIVDLSSNIFKSTFALRWKTDDEVECRFWVFPLMLGFRLLRTQSQKWARCWWLFGIKLFCNLHFLDRCCGFDV